jgi:hypothetical protein
MFPGSRGQHKNRDSARPFIYIYGHNNTFLLNLSEPDIVPGERENLCTHWEECKNLLIRKWKMEFKGGVVWKNGGQGEV